MNIQDAINVLELLECEVEPVVLNKQNWVEGHIINREGVAVGKLKAFRGELNGIKWYRRYTETRNRFSYYEHCGRILSEEDYKTLCESGRGFTLPRKAPWPDYRGGAILENDLIEHPDGTVGQVAFFDQYKGQTNQWRVIYGDTGSWEISRLCIQVGDSGMAIVLK